MEISSDHTTVGSEARKQCYLCWKIWFALTEGEQAVFVPSRNNHPLLPQNKHWCMLCTHISESGGLPEVNRLDKQHKVTTGTVRGTSCVWTFLLSKSAAQGWCGVKICTQVHQPSPGECSETGAPQVNTARSKTKQNLCFPCRGKFPVYYKFCWSLSKTEQITLDLCQHLRR